MAMKRLCWSSIISMFFLELLFEEILLDTLKNSSHYLPHCLAIKETSVITQTGQVFNVSVKKNCNSALNDRFKKCANMI